MKVNEDTWKFMQKHLGYTDEELELFRSNPKNADIMSKAPDLMNKTIIAEVVASHGCNSRHQVGDKFYFDGAGNLLTKMSPKRICIHALSALSGPIYTANELFYAVVGIVSYKIMGRIHRSLTRNSGPMILDLTDFRRI